jgi:hypothetical protein
VSGLTGAIGAVDTLYAVVPGGAAVGGMSIVATIVQLVLVIAVYVWLALALSAVFAKVGRPTWKAWVPVYNIWTLFEVAGMKGWWAAVQAGAGIVVAIVGGVVTAAAAEAVVDAGFSGGGAQGAVIGAGVTLVVLWVLYGALVLILQIRMMLALCRGFSLGVGFVVLGVVLLPLWASLVGWGAAQWRGIPTVHTGGIPPTPFAAPDSAPAQAAPAAPQAPAAAFAPAPGAPVVPGTAPAAPVAPPTNNPWMPPPAAPVAAPAPAPAAPSPAPAPAAAAPAPAAPAAAPAPADDDLDEHTVLAAHRRPTTTLTLPGGITVSLRSEVAVLGRNPVAPSDSPGAQRVPIDDVTRTVSKTHALLRRDAGQWTITDLASTNGVFVGPADAETEVTAPTALSGRFLLGDAELHLADS